MWWNRKGDVGDGLFIEIGVVVLGIAWLEILNFIVSQGRSEGDEEVVEVVENVGDKVENVIWYIYR